MQVFVDITNYVVLLDQFKAYAQIKVDNRWALLTSLDHQPFLN
ncbi:hypothetical protein [Nostoc sp. CHAB 5715]|nr:hypothetical protein [Nostoc sp. CHAB 5715]